MEQDFSFETIVMSLPEPIIVLDKQEMIRVMNRAACELFDVDANSLVGASIGKLPGSQSYYERKKMKRRNNLAPNQDVLFWNTRVHNRLVQFQATSLLIQQKEKVGTVITVHNTSVEWTESTLLGMF